VNCRIPRTIEFLNASCARGLPAEGTSFSALHSTVPHPFPTPHHATLFVAAHRAALSPTLQPPPCPCPELGRRRGGPCCASLGPRRRGPPASREAYRVGGRRGSRARRPLRGGTRRRRAAGIGAGASDLGRVEAEAAAVACAYRVRPR